ncbi:(deoxy)nucleoside triphosphate pyrophosphohydrolase [Jatrophihabitans fulvus]
MTDANDAAIAVVGAAIVDGDGQVLAARRAAPHRHAGRWEFPGGKVEPGEDAQAALIRECHEELGVAVRVGVLLGEAVGDGIRLALFAATVDQGLPTPVEDHDQLRWLAEDELGDVEWLPVDRDLLPAVTAHLRDRAGGGRL